MRDNSNSIERVPDSVLEGIQQMKALADAISESQKYGIYYIDGDGTRPRDIYGRVLPTGSSDNPFVLEEPYD